MKDPPAFGVPGLEAAVGLLGLAVHQNKITKNKLMELLSGNPQKIFNIPDRPDSYVELDLGKSYTFPLGGHETKCGWSPYEGWTLWGKIETVAVKGEKIFENGIFSV